MMVPEQMGESGRTRMSKLGWLIAGRLVAALVLSVFSTIWTRASESQLSIDKNLTLLTIVACLTIAYTLIFRLSKNVLVQARFQIVVDILLVTWLVWNFAVIQSPYIALYIVIIAVSSLFLGPREAIVTSVGCAAAFTACIVALAGLLGPTPSANLVGGSISETIQWIGLFDIAFLVVGLLSAKLAERQTRSDVRLLAAKQSLANLRALHERIIASIRSGLVTTDLAGRIYTFNAAAEEITGYSEQTIRGEDATILFGDLKDHIARSLRALENGQPSPRFETNCQTSEGMRLRLGYSISPLSSEAGETTGIVITFQDLTHVRTLEETSRRQDRLAAIGRMAASIAHEIRNPLAAMRGSIQMLRAEVDNDSSQAELMEIILRESDRLNGIITDFLSYARPRSLKQARVFRISRTSELSKKLRGARIAWQRSVAWPHQSRTRSATHSPPCAVRFRCCARKWITTRRRQN